MKGLAATGASDPTAVVAFEQAFGQLLGARHAIAVSSGKAALASILIGLGARPGDGVVLSAYNVPEVVSVVIGLGLRPQLVDIDPATYTLPPHGVEQAIDDTTRFVVATHFYGNPADMHGLRAVAERRHLLLIEDCAQALSATFEARPVGTLGHPALFSFGLMKTFTTLGGGMVVTDDDGLAQRIRAAVSEMPEVGRLNVLKALAIGVLFATVTSPRPFALLGYPLLRLFEGVSPTLVYKLAKMRPVDWDFGKLNVDAILQRMHPAQARCGLVGLSVVEEETRLRVRNAARLAQTLAGLDAIHYQMELPGGQSAWTQFVVRTPNRVALKTRLLAKGIDTTIGYLLACNSMPGLAGGEFPHSEALETQNLHLPIGAELSEPEVDRIGECVRQAVLGTAPLRAVPAPARSQPERAVN